MVYIPKKVEERIKKNFNKYKRILKRAHEADINESDTVIILTDMLEEVFGYDKFTEITTEYVVKGTYCDLAIKHGDEIFFLIEAKAIGLTLKDHHLNQALNYAANSGVDWVVLTNGVDWEIYRVIFKKPMGKEQLFAFNIFDLSLRDEKTLEWFFLLSKEGLKKAAISEFQEQKQAMNKYTVAQILQDDAVVNVVARELRKLFKGIKIDKEIVQELIHNDVLKRDVIIGDRAEQAQKRIKKIQNKQKRKEAQKKTKPKPPEPKLVPPPPPEPSS